MKNAEELYDDYTLEGTEIMPFNKFKDAIERHDQELISEIEKKIGKLEESRSGGRLTGAALAGVNITIIRLTEILNLIRGK